MLVEKCSDCKHIKKVKDFYVCGMLYGLGSTAVIVGKDDKHEEKCILLEEDEEE